MASYVVYVPGDGLSVGFKTLEDSIREAHEALQEHQEDGEWTDGAEFIAVLQVVANVVDISKDPNVMDLKIRPVDVCTCPVLDGVQVTGSACPVHGMPKCSLQFSTEDD